MTPADGIRRLGFHRWYERQLIESHVYLVTGLLSLVMVLACVEGFSFREPGLKPFLTLALMMGGLVLCGASVHRYLSMLTRANHLAEQSACGGCGSNGRLRVTGSRVVSGTSGEAEDEGTIEVECRRCGHRWTMAGPA